jgi:predicted metal-dependent RNase
MGENGRIFGGNIYAVHSLRAGAIGKRGSPPAHIHCGIDFAAEQEKENNKSQLHAISVKIQRLREMLDESIVDKEVLARIKALLKKLEDERKTVTDRLTKVMGNINIDEKAFVEVSGEITVGTLIEICQVALFVDEPLKRVRIRLDKEKNKLVPDPL